MAVNSENEKLYQMLNRAPASPSDGEAAQMAAVLSEAETAAQQAAYDRTADARLDRAIGDYLKRSGYNYDISNDAGYREFARSYSQNALSGRERAQEGANRLSGGYTPSYADAVGSAVQQDIAANAANYAQAFRQLGRQEAAQRAAQAGNAAQIYGQLADTSYQRLHAAQGDRMQYMQYLADRYGTARQADAQRQGYAGDIYRAQLSGALQNATEARSIDNSRYQFDGQSAESRAKLAADQTQFEQKLAYQAAEDAYKDRIAAQKAQAAADKEAAKEQAAAEKAAQAQQKQDAKDAAALEKQKKGYDKAAYIIDYMLKNGKEFSASQMADYDYNRDGKVDAEDHHLAAVASLTGALPDNAAAKKSIGSAKATNMINMIRRNGSHYGTLDKQTLGKLVEQSSLSPEEAIYVYQYFGV